MTGNPEIRVNSEVGRLRRVLMHTPGREHQRIPPQRLKDNLVEDILHLPTAAAHAKIIQEVVRRSGAEVIQFRDLLFDILNQECSRRECLRQLGLLDRRNGHPIIDTAETKSLVQYLIEGNGIDVIPDLDPIPNVAF